MTYLDQVRLRLGEAVKAGEVIPFPLFPIGNWKSAKYPNLPLTRGLAETLIANFEAGILGTEPMLDSSGKHDTSAPAAAWFKRLHIEPTTDGGEMLFGDGQLTDIGADLLNGQAYKYLSIELGSVVDNRSGKQTDDVFKSGTLTNTPVLRMMPAVLDAADRIAVKLSEITGEDDDPVQDLLSDLEAIATKLDESLKGKKGMPSVRAFLREVRSKVSAHKLAEDGSYQDLRNELESALGSRRWVVDFGDDWVIYEYSQMDGAEQGCYRAPYVRTENGITLGDSVEVKRVTDYVPLTPAGDPASPPALSEPASPQAKGDEDARMKLAGVDGSQEGGGMDPTIIKALKLSEGASEADASAAILVLSERAEAGDAAVLKLAEVEKAKRASEVEVTLSELITGGHVAPGQKDTWLKLAEAAPEQFEAMAEAAKAHTIIDLAEHGTAQKAPAEKICDDPSIELAEKAAAKIAAGLATNVGTAQDMVLAEDAALRTRYLAPRER